MADMTTIKERIAETIYPNGTGAITAASHQQLLLDMVDDINAKKQDAEAGKGLVSDVEREQWNEKAEVDGRYPSMSVGFSDHLAGHGESVPAEFSFRASGGRSILDGTARIKELRGNAVVWNQLVQAIDGTSYGYSAKWENGKIILTNVSASTPDYGNMAIIQGWIPIAGHKYVLLSDAPSSIQIGFSSLNGFADYAGIISTAPSLDYSMMYLRTNAAPSLDLLPVGGSIEFSFLIHDLTQMFGAGNEPTTIEEYEARKPIVEDEYAYNEGEVIHMTAEGIKSVGDNAWDEEWRNGYYENGEFILFEAFVANVNLMRVLPSETYYYRAPEGVTMSICYYDMEKSYIGEGSVLSNSTFVIPQNANYVNFRFGSNYGTTYNNDIMITLVHSGWKQDTDAGYQPYWEDRLMFDQRIKDEFPNGMSKWDMVYNKNGMGYIVKGMKVVDLGSLNWYYDASLGGFYSDALVGAKRLFDGICAKYPFVGDYRNVTDKTCGYVYEVNVLVKDSSYTDAATFKTAMNGVMLWYELAEPTIIEYDEPFNLDYEVWDFGTEQIIADTPSAPINANIIYQFNAVDMIRDHEARIAQLEALIVSLTNGGQ